MQTEIYDEDDSSQDNEGAEDDESDRGGGEWTRGLFGGYFGEGGGFERGAGKEGACWFGM